MKFSLSFLALCLFISSTSAIFFKARPASIVVQPGSIKSPAQQLRQYPLPSTKLDEIPQVPVISTQHDVQVVNVPVDQPVTRSQIIAVEPSTQSVHLVFKSSSSPISIQQQHQASDRTYHETQRTEEQPHIIRHEVFKPVVQELRETIQPYRHVTQEIKPVLEKVNIVVPRGQQIITQQIEQQTEQQQQQQSSSSSSAGSSSTSAQIRYWPMPAIKPILLPPLPPLPSPPYPYPFPIFPSQRYFPNAATAQGPSAQTIEQQYEQQPSSPQQQQQDQDNFE